MDLASAPSLYDSGAKTHGEPADRAAIRVVSRQVAQQPAFLDVWERLVLHASEPNPFFEPWFALPSASHLARAQEPTFIAHVTGGTLTGLVPVSRNLSYYGYPLPHASVWLHPNSFCGAPLVARGHEVSFWSALLEQLDSAPQFALFLHLPLLPEAGPLNRALDQVLAESGRQHAIVQRQQRAMLASSLGPQGYLASSLSAKKRKELRRQQKRLAELGTLTFERLNDNTALERWVSDFLLLESAGWKGKAGSALAKSTSSARFFSDTLTRAANAGRLERLALRLNEEPIAMLANFISPPGAFSFKTAFDERFARFSPGLLLQLENLALLDRTELAWADSCASEGHPMIERLWRERRTMVSRNIALGGTLRRAAFAALTARENRRSKSS